MADGGVFISYRHQDVPYVAGRLRDHLVARYGEARVFRDIDVIGPGTNFPRRIREALASCSALIAVIGRSWLRMTDRSGNRRLDHPKDWVRLEIAGALKQEVLVIPVLVDDAKMPSEDDLPEDLRQLASIAALEVSEKHWDYEMGRLTEALEAAGIRPIGVDDLLREGGELIAREEWTLARDRLETILTHDPANDEADRKLSEVTSKLQKVEPEPPRLSATLHPAVIRSRVGGRYRLDVHNGGGKVGEARLGAPDDGPLSIEIEPHAVDVDPGRTGAASVLVKPRSGLLLGREQQHPVRVRLTTDASEEKVAEATFVHRPRFRTPLVLAGVVPLVLLAGLALFLLNGPVCDAGTVLGGGVGRARDASGNGCDGTYQGPVTWERAGPFVDPAAAERYAAAVLDDRPLALWMLDDGGGAATFDGASAWVSLPQTPLDGDFTIEAWVFLEEGRSGQNRILGRRECSEMLHFRDERLTMFDPPGTDPGRCVDVVGGGVNNRVSSETLATPSVWTYWAVVRTDDRVAIFRDGRRDFMCPPGITGSGDGCPLHAREPFRVGVLGRARAKNDAFLDGSLAAVAVYDRALSPDGILAHHRAAATPTGTG